MTDAVLAPQARRDLASAVRWIAQDNPDAAERLNDAVLDAARRLGTGRFLGRRAPPPLLPRYRFWSLPRFAYLLVYDPARSRS